MEHQANDLAALQKKRAKLTAEIEAETLRLLAERSNALKTLDDTAEIRQTELKAELHKLNKAIEIAREALVEPEIALAGVTSEVRTLSGRKATLETDIVTLTADKVSLTTTNVTLASQNQYLDDQLAPLRTELGDLRQQRDGQIEWLRSAHEHGAKVATQYKADEQKAADSVAVLLAQKDELTIYLSDRQREFDSASEAIGRRQLLQDERDENLRIREMRVNEDQRQIAKNARLLNM